MRPIHIGQRVEIDLFGLQVGDGGRVGPAGTGTVVALDPGVITVRLEHGLGAPSEVTVSQRRVLGRLPWR
jgi:hypothetical protein